MLGSRNQISGKSTAVITRHVVASANIRCARAAGRSTEVREHYVMITLVSWASGGSVAKKVPESASEAEAVLLKAAS